MISTKKVLGDIFFLFNDIVVQMSVPNGIKVLQVGITEMLYQTAKKIINDALSHDIGMFVYFMTMLHHIQMGLCSKSQKITVLPYKLCSSELALSDFFFFPKLKQFLYGCRQRPVIALQKCIKHR